MAGLSGEPQRWADAPRVCVLQGRGQAAAQPRPGSRRRRGRGQEARCASAAPGHCSTAFRQAPGCRGREQPACLSRGPPSCSRWCSLPACLPAAGPSIPRPVVLRLTAGWAWFCRPGAGREAGVRSEVGGTEDEQDVLGLLESMQAEVSAMPAAACASALRAAPPALLPLFQAPVALSLELWPTARVCSQAIASGSEGEAGDHVSQAQAGSGVVGGEALRTQFEVQPADGADL